MFCDVCGSDNGDSSKACRICSAPLSEARRRIQFAYVCQKDFYELRGDGDDKRYCSTCGFDVVNLDPLDESARRELFRKAAQSNARICVSVTQPLENSEKCPNRSVLPVTVRTGGMPVIPQEYINKRLGIKNDNEAPKVARPPDAENLKNNEEQFGKQSEDGFFARVRSKLKFW